MIQSHAPSPTKLSSATTRNPTPKTTLATPLISLAVNLGHYPSYSAAKCEAPAWPKTPLATLEPQSVSTYPRSANSTSLRAPPKLDPTATQPGASPSTPPNPSKWYSPIWAPKHSIRIPNPPSTPPALSPATAKNAAACRLSSQTPAPHPRSHSYISKRFPGS